jgi:L-cysteine:1D-myo-inositol 2-amino-2-deoxy-alpha-D-glucopyranoside ligase
LARHWLHAALVWKDGHKMSKSLGNLVFISDLRKEWEARAIRLMLLSERYRHDWHWNEQRMSGAAARLERWVDAGDGDAALDDVRLALDDDLDTPRALAAIDDAVAAGRGVSRAAALLGIPL